MPRHLLPFGFTPLTIVPPSAGYCYYKYRGGVTWQFLDLV